jgi:hypothetical protein
MRRWLLLTLSGALLAGAVLGVALAPPWQAPPPARGADEETQPVALKVPAPDFEGIGEWINSKPLGWPDLRGRVVVVHFWTFG